MKRIQDVGESLDGGRVLLIGAWNCKTRARGRSWVYTKGTAMAPGGPGTEPLDSRPDPCMMVDCPTGAQARGIWWPSGNGQGALGKNNKRHKLPSAITRAPPGSRAPTAQW